ncbi:MAG TPA: hypothetical protein VG272_02405 [Candidatus Acidoferrales bacterium]|nr:hypothetical protein [Candidatus Acidoferrales bacterium]
MPPSQISCFWKQPEIARQYRTAVSLHSHTNQSKESLLFIPAFAEKRPLLRWALNEQIKKSVRPVDFSQAYWTPPLPPKLAYELESSQIEDNLELVSLVSLTDHDSIEAPAILRQSPNPVQVPFAVEWSVPFEGAIFHLGIHNLPQSQAHLIMDDLSAYSRNPSAERLVELLSSLHSIPDVLIVFNHPHWDQYCLGEATFRNFVDRFLQGYVEYIHAFELNAMRAWTENKSVIELAAAWQRPLISGGDRHGLEPSAALNLTCATTFSEFINEIRVEQLSHILFMPQYSELLGIRFMQTVIDTIRDYPDHPVGSRRWDERVFHMDFQVGYHRPLSCLWKVPPSYLGHIFSIFRMIENTSVRHALNFTFREKAKVHRALDVPRGVSA